MAGRYMESRSVPVNQIDNPRTLLTNTTHDQLLTFISRSRSKSRRRFEEGDLTSLSSFRIKPQVLVTDVPERLSSVLKKTKYTSLIPFMSRLRQRPQLKGFLTDILTKSIIICIVKQSINNKEYIQFILDLMNMRQEELGKGNEIAIKVLKIKALMIDGVKSLPSELNELFPISMEGDLLPENVADLIEGSLDAAVKYAEAVLAEIDYAPRQMIFLKIRLPGVDNADYMNKCWKALLETFDDAASAPRQYLLQLLQIPNVETIRMESDAEKHQVCVEIQPNSIKDYLHFLDACHSRQFPSVVQDNLKVYSHNFGGVIEAIIDGASAVRVLKYFQPNVSKYQEHVVKQLVKNGKLEELQKMVKGMTIDDANKEDRVHKLSTICATKIYEAFLKRSDLSPFQYLKYMEKAGTRDFLTEIRTADGYNALHLAVKEESEDYMKMLFYANKWGFLRRYVVKPVNIRLESQHVGYVPRRLAEALSFRDTGFHILKKFDAYERIIRYMPPLHKACLGGSLPFVSSMVEIHPHLMEVKDESGNNCLFYACASGNDKLVQYLLAKGVPRNVRNEEGETPLHIAAMFGHLNVLRVLGDNHFDLRGRRTKLGYDALYYLVRFGDLEALRLYKEKGFKIDAKALTIAAKHKQNEVFDYILKQISDVNEGRDDEGRLALHYAVISGNVAAVEKLIERKADVTLLDKYDQNVLHLAAQYGQKGAMETVINEARRVGCLKKMISTKNVFTSKDLLVVIRGKDRGRKAWHYVELKRLYVRAFERAMKTGQIDVARYGSILKSEFGAYPDDECQQMMEKKLEDILAERRKDMTPLLVAALKDNRELVQILLSNGASAKDRDYQDATALHYAAMNNNVKILDLLFNAGATLEMKTVDGQTALDLAENLGNKTASNFLQAFRPSEKAKKVHAMLSIYEEKMSQEKLIAMKENGKDLRMYIIDCLRDLNIEINAILLELGSGPVHQVSES